MILALLLLAPVQSFDCRKAETAIEKMVCADPELSALDEQLATAFAAARARGDVEPAHQRAWLKDVRARCADIACLKQVYRVRIEGLGRPLEGEWRRIGGTRHDAGVLRISGVTATAVEFALVAHNGMRTGEVEGVAERRGAAARFVEAETGCEVRLRREGSRIRVSTSSACAQHAGMGVSFDGEYGVGEPEPPVTLTGLGVLDRGVTEAAFAALTGGDYRRFVDSMDDMLADEKDLDALGTKAVSGWVRSADGEAAAIVMSRGDGRIYAAVVDDDVIRYYSNDPAFKAKLPATIDQWRGSLGDRKVVFASR